MIAERTVLVGRNVGGEVYSLVVQQRFEDDLAEHLDIDVGIVGIAAVEKVLGHIDFVVHALGPDRVIADLDVLAQVHADAFGIERLRRIPLGLAPILLHLVAVILTLVLIFFVVTLSLVFIVGVVILVSLALVTPGELGRRLAQVLEDQDLIDLGQHPLLGFPHLADRTGGLVDLAQLDRIGAQQPG